MEGLYLSKILITGVAGFIGSNLAHALLDRGYTVAGLDNMSQGSPLNMAAFANHPLFQFYQTDIRDEKSIIEAAEGCQTIVHLAAYKIPRYSDALDTLLINSLGSENVIKTAIATGARLLAASTSDVYGKNPQVPFSESSDSVIGSPDVKRWAYAISKMFEEQLLFAYHERHGLEFNIFRFFGGYGPNQNLTWWGGPQSVFINNALDDEEIPIHGTGEQTRSFTYISDHVSGIIATIEHPEFSNMVFNLGNTYEITISDLATLIWRLVRGESSTPKIRFIPYESFGKYEDVQRRIPDIQRAREMLSFEPLVDLEEGLHRTIRWQISRRQELNIPTPELV
jgi:UDP-glucose 4-epimerase